MPVRISLLVTELSGKNFDVQWHHGSQSAGSPVACEQEVLMEDKALGSAVNSALDVDRWEREVLRTLYGVTCVDMGTLILDIGPGVYNWSKQTLVMTL